MPTTPVKPITLVCGLIALLPVTAAIVLPNLLCRSAEQMLAPIRTFKPTPSNRNPSLPIQGPAVAYETIRLQRIEPQPIAIAPIPPPSQPLPSPPLGFQGQLIGTILDTDPAFSYAVIELPNKQIRLVRQSMAVDENDPRIILHHVSNNKVVLLLGDTTQELELPPRNIYAIQ